MACRAVGISFLVAVLTIDIVLGQGPDQQVRSEPRSPTPEELEAVAQEAQGVKSLLAIVPLSHVEDPSLAVTDGTWVPQGPGPNRFGQVQNLNPNNEVFGAIHAVVAHPSDANIMYIGAVNGGIWRSTAPRRRHSSSGPGPTRTSKRAWCCVQTWTRACPSLASMGGPPAGSVADPGGSSLRLVGRS